MADRATSAYYWGVKDRERSAGTLPNKKDADRAWQWAEAKVAEGRLGVPGRGPQTFQAYVEQVWLPGHQGRPPRSWRWAGSPTERSSGAQGFAAPSMVSAFVLAAAVLVAFDATRARSAHPMVPLGLFRSRNVSDAVAVGFAFMAGYYGLPFVVSRYLQQLWSLSPLAAGVAFLPMMLIGAALTPFSARIAERLGARVLATGGLILMTAGLVIIGLAPSSAPTWALAAAMILVGLAGPFVMPPVTAVLLDSVPGHRAGVASGVFNTSRQVGGALAVAVFGALLANRAMFTRGVQVSLLLGATVALAAVAASLLLKPTHTGYELAAEPA